MSHCPIKGESQKSDSQGTLVDTILWQELQQYSKVL